MELCGRASSLAICAGALTGIFAAGAAVSAQAAAVTINPVQATTYALQPSQNPVTFGGGTNIDNAGGDAVFSTRNTHWTITNDGQLKSTSGVGLDLESATITLTNEGNIYGATAGVWAAKGTVTNDASIFGHTGNAIEIDGAGVVVNNGEVSGEDRGVMLGGGQVYNHSLIESVSHAAVELGQGTVANYGTIQSSNGPGVSIHQTGAVFNSDYIYGYSSGVTAKYAPITVTNESVIRGREVGVYLTAGGKVANSDEILGGAAGVAGLFEAAGSTNVINNKQFIEGGYVGVVFEEAYGPIKNQITNSGLIEGGDVGVWIAGGVINNSGVIVGSETGIHIDQAPGTINNSGLILGDTAIEFDSAGTLNNTGPGAIVGVVTANAAFTFNNAGYWRTSGFNYLGAGGTVTNTGFININGSAEFAGLSSFTNGSKTTPGVISMVNGSAGDSLTIDAPFNGMKSFLDVDAYLGGPGSTADELHLNAGSSGHTIIEVNDVNSGSGAINSQGIVIVTGATSANDFALDQHAANFDRHTGGIDKGLYVYKLQFNNGTFALYGYAGGPAYQLATTQSAGSNILGSTDFSPGSDGGSGGGAGFMGFTGSMGFSQSGQSAAASAERPMFWTSSVGTLSSNPLFQGAFTGAPGQSPAMADPAMRLTSIQSSGGYSTGYDQGLSMLKGGVDLIRADHFKLGFGTAYIQSDQRFADGNTAMFYSGVVYGGYAAFSSGASWAQLDAKSAMLKGQYAAPWLQSSGPPSAGLNASGITLKGGYSVDLAQGWSLQPLAEAAAQRTSMSDLQVEADLVRFKSAYDGWANAGARLTGETRAFGFNLSTSLTARVWDRFGDQDIAYLQGDSSPLADRLNGVSGETAAEIRISKGENLYGFVETSARAGSAQKTAAALAGFAVRW